MRKPKGYWTKERCQAEALKYMGRGSFQHGSGSARAVAHINGWLDEICGHMVQGCKPRRYWTKERCQVEALRFTTRFEFRRGKSAAYSASCVNGWLDEICAHMSLLTRPKGYWTKERCQVEALKYMGRWDFQRGNRGAHTVARKRGWLDEICGHMVFIKRPKGHWTKERCQVEALRFTTRWDFNTGSSSYAIANKQGWLDDICGHMVSGGRGFNPEKPGILYYYQIGDLFKIGITNLTVRKRVGKQFASIRVLAEKHFPIGADAVKAERAIKRFVDAEHRYDGPPVLEKYGDTELYTCDILGLAA